MIRPTGYNLLVELHPGSQVYITVPLQGVRGSGRGKVIGVGKDHADTRWEGCSVIFNPEHCTPVGPDDKNLWIVPDQSVVAVVDGS